MKKQLSKSEIKELNEKLASIGLVDFFDKKDRIELIKDHETHQEFILCNNEVSIFYHDNKAVPTIKLLLKRMVLPTVVVDMGAVKFVAEGADLMRPGIKFIDFTLQKSAVVAIVDEKNQRPIAVGELMFSAQEILSMEKGKVIKNIHHVGDKIWEHKVL